MKIGLFSGGRVGVVDGQNVFDVTDAVPAHQEFPVLWVAGLSADRLKSIVASSKNFVLSDIKFDSPISRPGKVIAAPANYRAHVEEMAKSGQDHGHLSDIRTAGLFLKASSSVVGPAHGIRQRFLERRTDYEVELCVVIGSEANQVTAKEAHKYIAGYCLGLDITVRGPEERSFRKSMDTYCVLGPWLTTSDELGDSSNVDLLLTSNGQIKQQTNTSDMVMNVGELIEFASSFYTLFPGDVIMTGTPQGVGPIRPGDVLVAKGSRLGEMTTLVS